MGNFNLKSFRMAKSLKQSELADLLKMTQSSLSRFETNGMDISDEQFNLLYSVYGKEEVDAYRTNDNSVEVKYTSDPSKEDLVSVIMKQADTIGQQSDIINKIVERQAKTNERLLDLLDKITLS